jgi:hypothetical protein
MEIPPASATRASELAIQKLNAKREADDRSLRREMVVLHMIYQPELSQDPKLLGPRRRIRRSGYLLSCRLSYFRQTSSYDQERVPIQRQKYRPPRARDR